MEWEKGDENIHKEVKINIFEIRKTFSFPAADSVSDFEILWCFNGWSCGFNRLLLTRSRE